MGIGVAHIGCTYPYFFPKKDLFNSADFVDGVCKHEAELYIFPEGFLEVILYRKHLIL